MTEKYDVCLRKIEIGDPKTYSPKDGEGMITLQNLDHYEIGVTPLPSSERVSRVISALARTALETNSTFKGIELNIKVKND